MVMGVKVGAEQGRSKAEQGKSERKWKQVQVQVQCRWATTQARPTRQDRTGQERSGLVPSTQVPTYTTQSTYRGFVQRALPAHLPCPCLALPCLVASRAVLCSQLASPSSRACNSKNHIPSPPDRSTSSKPNLAAGHALVMS